MLLKQLSQTRLLLMLCTGVYAAVFIAILVLRPFSPAVYKCVLNVLQTGPPLFAGFCGIVYAWRGQHSIKTRRLGWLLIGCGCISWGFGQGMFTYYENVLHKVPFPSVADAAFLGAYPFFIAGVLLLFGSMHIAGRTRLLLDSAIAASSVGVLSWYFLIEKLWNQSDVSQLGKILTIAYPLGDIFVLFSTWVLLSGVAGQNTLRRSVISLTAGITLVALTDSIWNYYTLNSAYETGSWFDPGWFFGFLLIGCASLVSLWWPEREEKNEKTESARRAPIGIAAFVQILTLPMLMRAALPYAAATIAFFIVASDDLRQDGELLLSTVAAGLWLISLAILRQVLTLLENQHLTEQLRSLNTNLEEIVGHRTRQLSAILQLTKAVNGTLDSDQVLAAAAEHAQQALKADAVIVRVQEGEKTGMTGRSATSAYVGVDRESNVLDFVNDLPLSENVKVGVLPVQVQAGQPGTGDSLSGSYLCAPILWQGQLVGMVACIRWNNTFEANEGEVLESIGLEVGAAFKNSQLYAIALEAADRDPLTGIYNHRAIHQRLDAEFSRAERQSRPLSIMMMDLNNFKLFNDTYGHPVGDEVLKRVANVLAETCRASDVLGRYGGDEFIAILPDTDQPLAMVVAQRLKDRMSREGFQSTGDKNTIPVALSFGIATFPEDSSNRYELLTIADANLYTAKFSETGITATTDTQRAHRELRTENSFDVLDSMVTAVDNKDHYTRRHSEDVTEYSLWIAEELGLSEETQRIVRIGGLLHDVGKIGVPESILHKPGRLTNEEFEVMKQHPQLGALIVGGVPGMKNIVDAVRYHHERWDGKGYPEGLAGDAIPLMGRLLAVADAFSAMTTSRPYRKGLAWEEAMGEIRANIGTQFDPVIAQAFLVASQKRRPMENPALQLVRYDKSEYNHSGETRSPHEKVAT